MQQLFNNQIQTKNNTKNRQNEAETFKLSQKNNRKLTQCRKIK